MRTRVLNTLAIAALLAAVVGLSACSKSKKKMIAKTWSISNVDMGQPAATDSLSMAMMNAMTDAMKQATFTFKEDGSFEMSMMGMSSKGTWKLNDDESMLITKEEGKDAEQQNTIVECSDTKLVLSEKGEDGKEMKMTLEPKK